MERTTIEVVTRAVGSVSHCPHCQAFIDGVGVGNRIHRADALAYPPDVQAEWNRLMALIGRLAARFPEQLFIRLTDAQSPRGFWLALRGVRRYPAFLIGGERVFGYDEEAVVTLLKRHGAQERILPMI